MILELTKDYLYEISKPFVFDGNNALDLFNDLKETMIHNKLYGLSANMIGELSTVFVMGDWQSPDSILGIFNPKITFMSKEKESLVEGCTAFPGTFIKIKRSKSIRFRAFNYEGFISTQTFTGLSSRVFQHEYDHLNGISFKTRANLYHRNKKKVNINGNFVL
jgi:peptide deformylase